VFDWFNSVGGTKLRPFRSNPTIPGVTTKINGSLDSPNVMEYAGGVSRQLGGRGTVRADFTYRDYRDFYATVTNLSTGRVTDSEGQSFDFSVVDNTNAVKRRYAGLAIQSNYRFGDRLDVSGNYTLSRLWGSINGENIGSGPIRTGVLAYPEYFDVAWNNPEGDLAADQRHRVRLWATYRTPIAERHGSLSLSAIEIVQSGTPYGASGTVDTTTAVANPGYLTPPATVTYFFTARDAFHADAQVRTDLAVNYAFKLPGGSQRELFFQAQLLNVFNRFQLIDVQGGNIDTSVLARTNNASYQTFNPFTTTPVRGVNWDYAPSFGQALSADAYTVQRTFRMNFGVRF